MLHRRITWDTQIDELLTYQRLLDVECGQRQSLDQIKRICQGYDKIMAIFHNEIVKEPFSEADY